MALDGELVCAVRWDGAWLGGKEKGMQCGGNGNEMGSMWLFLVREKKLRRLSIKIIMCI
jgi:hypothetical protein